MMTIGVSLGFLITSHVTMLITLERGEGRKKKVREGGREGGRERIGGDKGGRG